MKRVPLRRTINGFAAAGPDAEEAMAKIPRGQCVMVHWSRPRNIRHHRLYFALCKLVSDNTDRGWTTDDVHEFFKLSTGHYREVVDVHGAVHKFTNSIAFESMDQDKFSEFFDKVIRLVCERIIPSLPEGELRAELEEIIA